MSKLRKFPLKAGIFFNFRSFKNGKLIRKHTSPRKIAFLAKATHVWDVERPDKMLLRVSYREGNVNEGEYFTKKSWVFAYQAFTEQALIRSLSV